MEIAYIRGCSCVDWDGKLSAVVFTQGCNFRCAYCYNKELIEWRKGRIDVKNAVWYLVRIGGFIDGVVITGGEPTIHGNGLVDFIVELKELGFNVKLDTNGSNPGVLKKAIDCGVDYIAMDVKYKLNEYEKVCGVRVDAGILKKSMKMIVDSGVEYEFRTTVLNWFTENDLIDIMNEIRDIGGEKYVLQAERGKVDKKRIDEIKEKFKYLFDEIKSR